MIKCLGIVLKATPFEEASKIVSIFTLELGVIHVVCKNISAKRLDLLQGTTPLVEGIYHLQEGRSELYKLQDVTIVTQHEGIKTDFAKLKVGIEMLSAIEMSQLKQKSSPLLFQLLSKCLKELEKSQDPNRLLICFYLKLLRHEGLFEAEHFEEELKICRNTIEEIAFATKFESLYTLSLKLEEMISLKEKAHSLLFC